MKASLLLVLAFAAFALADWNPTFTLRSDSGRVQFVRGSLGTFDPLNAGAYFSRPEVARLLNLRGGEQFHMVSTDADTSGLLHSRFSQTLRGLEVDGGAVIVHFRPDTSVVFALTADVAPNDKDAPYTSFPASPLDARDALSQAAPSSRLTYLSDPSMVFLILEDEISLVYRATVRYPMPDGFPMVSKLYADPTTGERVAEVPLILMAENRTVYNANNGKTLPGSLARTENGSASQDNTVNQAFDNAGNCYDFYLNKLGRDSWDGKGGDMISTVHYDKNYNNAFWNGEQMVYGDGDGVNFIDFAGDLSVVCHELTHAVVQATAALRYLGESGALNEGWADAMGVSAVRYVNGGETATRWWIGPNCTLFAPALRFMQNPVMDNSSRDWYPDRYRGIADNGGVHWNSGIPNLAFVLFTEGGVHPQFKSSIYVNGVGWDNSEIVWYNALFYMTSTSNMAAAAAATETAALCNTQITNNHEIATAASTAWQAVGVLNASADRGLSAAC